MKSIYIVDHFVAFPTSEYGGVWNVIAENDNECFDLIADADGDDNVESYGKLRENIMKAFKFPLANEEESRVVDSFLT
ncbi:hypothetical protein [Synechococcus phage DSL-LC02]|nr:hypothetical protein [Synechococcus phage DSL-LC02]